MELTKKQLEEMLDAQIKGVMTSSDFEGRMKQVLQEKFDDLRNNVTHPASTKDVKSLVETMGFAKVSGDHLITSKGSIINLKSKSTPWVSISEELDTWGKSFAKYLKTGSVGKLLSESVDTAGGYGIMAFPVA